MEERFLMSREGTASADHNSEIPACAVCGGKEGRHNRLTWQMSQQGITFEDVLDVNDWMERRQGQPSVLVLPDEGGNLSLLRCPVL